MKMTPTGQSFGAQWYFAAANAPLLGRTRFSSLNYIRPTTPPGIIGESPSAPRQWVNGKRPLFAPVGGGAYLKRGTADQFLDGVPSALVVPRPMDAYGEDRLGNPFPPVFPPFPTNSNPVTLTWTGGTVGRDSYTPGFEYNWHAVGLTWVWAQVFDLGWIDRPLWSCYPSTITLAVSDDSNRTLWPLRCVSFDGAHTSTWVDGHWGIMSGSVTLVTP